MFKNFKVLQPAEGARWLPLLQKNGYSGAALMPAALKIERMDPQLQQELLRWDKIGDFPDREVEGFTVSGLVENAGLHPIGAFLMMDWLLREPNEAKYALAQPLTRLEIDKTVLTRIAESEEADTPGNGEENFEFEKEQPDEVLYHS